MPPTSPVIAVWELSVFSIPPLPPYPVCFESSDISHLSKPTLLCESDTDSAAYLKESLGKETFIIQTTSGHHAKSHLPWKGGSQPGIFKSPYAAIATSEKMGPRVLKAHICLGLHSQRNLLMSEPKLQPMEAELFWKPSLEGTAKDSLVIWGQDKYRTRARNGLLSLRGQKCS